MNPILKYCKEAGISQTELAKKAGIHTSYITHIVKGRKIPSVHVALLLERAMENKVSAITILGLKNQIN